VLLLAICNALCSISESSPILDDNLIKHINSGGYPWNAARNKRFEGVSVAEAKKMMGTLKNKINENPKINNKKSVQDMPAQFDARKQWPQCVHGVLDQGSCGSCWAFGAVESLSDRFCIESNNSINIILSPESLVACDWEGNFGCNGGVPQLAWEYMEWAGVLTLACFPYTSGNGDVPECISTCDSNDPYKKYYANSLSIETYLTEWEIQNAILNDGPVEGTMQVYSDFPTYSSGVYVAASNATWLGGHAIKMVGWGHDAQSNLDYWIVQNSWGTDWGLDGFFWIQRGVDMCGIDRDASAGKAYLK